MPAKNARQRLESLEAKAPSDDSLPINWGPRFQHLPPMTHGQFRKMLKDLHESGAGRLPMAPPRERSPKS